MRGDDQASRYPPRGVWFALILAAFFMRTAVAQDAPGADARESAEAARPVGRARVGMARSGRAVLATVRRCVGPAGHRWGARRQVVCRIVNIAEGNDPIFEVEVYGEGEFRGTTQDATSLARGRALFRTPQVRMKAYRRGGIQRWAAPPERLEILRHSGFLTRRGPAVQAAAAAPVRAAEAAGPPPPLGGPGLPAGPLLDTMVTRARMAPQDPPDSGATGGTGATTSGGSPRPRRAGTGSTRVAETQVPPGGGTSAPAGSAPATGGRVQVPRGGSADAPMIDLPPIEGPPVLDVPAAR